MVELYTVIAESDLARIRLQYVAVLDAIVGSLRFFALSGYIAWRAARSTECSNGTKNYDSFALFGWDANPVYFGWQGRIRGTRCRAC